MIVVLLLAVPVAMAGTIQAFVRTVTYVAQSNRSSGNSNHQPSCSQNNTPTGQSLPANTQQPSSSQVPQLPQTSTAAGPPNSNTTTGLYCVNADTPVLLQTAQAYIHKPSNPSCGMIIRLMLDRGSQRSYINSEGKRSAKVGVQMNRESAHSNIWI